MFWLYAKKSIQSVKDWSEERPKIFLLELIAKLDSIQAERKEMRPACRAIYRTPIYNAMNYIKNVYAS